MNYIYDIVVNFLDDVHDFYEWNEENDCIEHIKKIPIFKISSKDMEIMQSHIFSIDQCFMNKIKNKTEVFDNKALYYINYACLFTDEKNILAFQFDYLGKVKKISTLLFDEFDDILNIVCGLKEIDFSYKILEEKRHCYFLTRKQREIMVFLEDNIKECYLYNKEKLNYLYYECFNKKCALIEKSYQELLDMIKGEITEQHLKLYDLLLLSSVKEQ